MSESVYLDAVLLGLVEGLTEFLPVSSTGHLILVGELLGFQGPPGKVFEVVIQFGAILAICILYLARLLNVAVRLPTDPAARRFTAAVLLAFLPSAVFGVLAHDIIKTVLFSPFVVSVALIIGGFAILAVERWAPAARIAGTEAIGWRTALLIGLCQCLALIPGVSRAGATIMGAVAFGVERRTAAEFSFFVAIPTMLGASVYDGYKNWSSFTADGVAVIAVGFVTAFLAAMLVVRPLLDFVGRHGFAPFAYYRIAVGCVMLALLTLA